jgi:pimeloyl-ACP methyl ester carboxylesterase
MTRRHLAQTRFGHVHWVEAGERGRDAVVLLHQTPRSVDEFAELLPRLASSYHVIAVDNPGYGCSDPIAGQPAIADYAEAVVAVMDDAGIARAHVCGHHTGAVVAVELAVGSPDRVRSAILSGPVFIDDETRVQLLPFFVQWHVQPDGTHFADKWQRFSRWEKDPALLQRLVLDVFRAGEASEQGHLAVVAYPMEARLPLVRCPGLMIYGSRDPFGYTAKSKRFLDYFQPGREVVLDGGVFMANEIPDAYAAAIREFVVSLGR